jgi:SAM-dependent methyltransferase
MCSTTTVGVIGSSIPLCVGLVAGTMPQCGLCARAFAGTSRQSLRGAPSPITVTSAAAAAVLCVEAIMADTRLAWFLVPLVFAYALVSVCAWLSTVGGVVLPVNVALAASLAAMAHVFCAFVVPDLCTGPVSAKMLTERFREVPSTTIVALPRLEQTLEIVAVRKLLGGEVASVDPWEAVALCSLLLGAMTVSLSWGCVPACHPVLLGVREPGQLIVPDKVEPARKGTHSSLSESEMDPSLPFEVDTTLEVSDIARMQDSALTTWAWLPRGKQTYPELQPIRESCAAWCKSRTTDTFVVVDIGSGDGEFGAEVVRVCGEELNRLLPEDARDVKVQYVGLDCSGEAVDLATAAFAEQLRSAELARTSEGEVAILQCDVVRDPWLREGDGIDFLPAVGEVNLVVVRHALESMSHRAILRVLWQCERALAPEGSLMLVHYGFGDRPLQDAGATLWGLCFLAQPRWFNGFRPIDASRLLRRTMPSLKVARQTQLPSGWWLAREMIAVVKTRTIS